jgi:TetR/AcrR family transcriptional regulator, transcriptional repressor for nem operon
LPIDELPASINNDDRPHWIDYDDVYHYNVKSAIYLSEIDPMKLTKKQAADNRQSIVQTAGRLFRERGLNGAGLADLMKTAGFTHGGFYNHFPSKTALAAEAALSCLRDSSSKLLDALRNERRPGSSGLVKFVETYLSPEHRDDRANGCTVAALGCDAARGDEEIQASFAQGIEEQLTIFASYFAKGHSKNGGASSARARAIQLMSQLVGAMILARAVARAAPSFSDEILQVSRRNILGKQARQTRARKHR